MTLSGWEAVFFWVFSIAAIFAGLLTVMARNTIHSALFLISSLVSVAALFILLHAEFIAGVQILVYVGGVMVLFLFVILLVAIIGSVMLARTLKQEAAVDDVAPDELAKEAAHDPEVVEAYNIL